MNHLECPQNEKGPRSESIEHRVDNLSGQSLLILSATDADIWLSGCKYSLLKTFPSVVPYINLLLTRRSWRIISSPHGDPLKSQNQSNSRVVVRLFSRPSMGYTVLNDV